MRPSEDPTNDPNEDSLRSQQAKCTCSFQERKVLSLALTRPKAFIFLCRVVTKATCDAEVINAVAFDMNLGALAYKEEKDGTVKLLRHELLEVMPLLSSAPAPALTCGSIFLCLRLSTKI